MHRRGAIQIPSELQEVIIMMFEKVMADFPMDSDKYEERNNQSACSVPYRCYCCTS